MPGSLLLYMYDKILYVHDVPYYVRVLDIKPFLPPIDIQHIKCRPVSSSVRVDFSSHRDPGT